MSIVYSLGLFPSHASQGDHCTLYRRYVLWYFFFVFVSRSYMFVNRVLVVDALWYVGVYVHIDLSTESGC